MTDHDHDYTHRPPPPATTPAVLIHNWDINAYARQVKADWDALAQLEEEKRQRILALEAVVAVSRRIYATDVYALENLKELGVEITTENSALTQELGSALAALSKVDDATGGAL